MLLNLLYFQYVREEFIRIEYYLHAFFFKPWRCPIPYTFFKHWARDKSVTYWSTVNTESYPKKRRKIKKTEMIMYGSAVCPSPTSDNITTEYMHHAKINIRRPRLNSVLQIKWKCGFTWARQTFHKIIISLYLS